MDNTVNKSVELILEEPISESEPSTFEEQCNNGGTNTDSIQLQSIHTTLFKSKNLYSEPRISRNVLKFVEETIIVISNNSINNSETSVEEIRSELCGLIVQKLVNELEPECIRKIQSKLNFTSNNEIDSSKGSETKLNYCSRKIQPIHYYSECNWVCETFSVDGIDKNYFAIERFNSNTPYQYYILILCPLNQKKTKSEFEVGKNICSFLTYSESSVLSKLSQAASEKEFREILKNEYAQIYKNKPNDENHEKSTNKFSCTIFTGIIGDLRRRIPYYPSDFMDGLRGNAIHKTLSTTFFLYFACLLPAIAFGTLNDTTTHGTIDVRKTIVGQGIGQLFYALLSGQPLSILATTAPLCLYTKVVHAFSDNADFNFHTFYALVGIWTSLFTFSYAIFDVSKIMKWCTRSTEEIFSVFITIALCLDAGKDTFEYFKENYSIGSGSGIDFTGKAQCILFLFLVLFTLWIGLQFYHFRNSNLFYFRIRETIADYALPLAVLISTLIKTFGFKEISIESFEYRDTEPLFKLVQFNNEISLGIILTSCGLGFCLSLLILMDQNISSAMVNNPANGLKKGPAYHWDLVIVSIINVIMSMYTFPWMHAVLPQSPLHMKCMADLIEVEEDGHIHTKITAVRETRLTGVLSHILICLSAFYFLPYPLSFIPRPVLDGLFLYIALTALDGNNLWERIKLCFTEQLAYPLTPYVRRVRQKIIHLFTGAQVAQLGLMCVIGFLPYSIVQMVFPVILVLLLPIRHCILPKFFKTKDLKVLD